jgi:hypothetical protein
MVVVRHIHVVMVVSGGECAPCGRGGGHRGSAQQ